jgi:YD repeat-containing protein
VTGGGAATISYSYDNLNRVTQTAAAGKTISYEYDKLGNRTKLIYPDSSFITYQYDFLNRLTGILDQGNATIAGYGYDLL